MLLSQFIRLAQTLKYFGYIKFDPCITDFPEKGCHVIVSAGNNELNFHVKLPNNQMKEGSFKVTRMRCWRVTSSVSVNFVEGLSNGISFVLKGYIYVIMHVMMFSLNLMHVSLLLVNGDLIMF